MIEDNREGPRCSAFKANGEACRAHAAVDSDLCSQHQKFPVLEGKRKKRVYLKRASDSDGPALPFDDWEVQVRAYFSMMAPDERADTMAALFKIIDMWQIDSGLLPPPKGWVLCDP